MKKNAYLVRNAHIVRPNEVATGDLLLCDGIISALGPPGSLTGEARGATVIRADGLYALPGFIDIHVHGGCGFDATLGMYNPATDSFDNRPSAFARGIPRALRAMAESGTTTALLTTLAADEDVVSRSLTELGAYVNSAANGRDGARLLGIFLEGAFIKFPALAGAQNPAYFRPPDVKIFEKWNELSQGTIRYVNVVPEHGPQGFRLMEHLSARGILVGAGHTDCTADEYAEAVRHGLRVAVHFTNGPTGSSLKTFGGGGALQAVLRSRRVYAELIMDGLHVNPAYVRDIIARKTPERIIGITDAMFVTGLRGVREFTVAGIRGQVSDDGRYLRVAEKRNTLFGSILRQDVVFANLLSWLSQPFPGVWTEEHPPVALEECILWATTMLSANPARVLGLYHPKTERLHQDLSHCCGCLEVGKRADVVLASITGSPGRYVFRVRETFVAGRRLRRS